VTEALFMGDLLDVFQNGVLEQIGKPEEVFHRSRTRFVAEFMGDSDFISSESMPDGVHISLGIVQQALRLPSKSKVEIAMRMDDVDFYPYDAGNGTIDERFFRGAFYIYCLRLDAGQIIPAPKPHTALLPVGMCVHAFFSTDHPLSVFRNGHAVN
jgi:iron(III) transport system ATP-binding protein